jgi:hypothetical protein
MGTTNTYFAPFRRVSDRAVKVGRARILGRSTWVATLGFVTLTSTVLAIGASSPANAVPPGTQTTVLSGLSGPWTSTFDTAGDFFVLNYSNNSLSVIPASTGTLFG